MCRGSLASDQKPRSETTTEEASQGPGTDDRLKAHELRWLCQSRKWEYECVSLISFKLGEAQKRKNPGLSVFMCMCTLLVFMWMLEKATLTVLAYGQSHLLCLFLGHLCVLR